jgi:DNA-binding XRE family transcriptional regulator
MSLGSKLREARIKVGLTQEKLARQLDVTTQTIYKIEKDRNVPSFSLVKRLAAVLGVSLDSL